MSTKLKIGLFIGLVLIVRFTAIGDIGGEENLRSLDPGTCVDLPDDLSRSRFVDVVDCALPHDGEVIGDANGTSEMGSERCAEAFDQLDPEVEFWLPDDVQVGTFGGSILRTCVVYSPSGALTVSIYDLTS